MKENTNTEKSKKNTVIIIAALIVIIIAAAAALYFSGVFSPKTETANGVVGRITDDWDPGIEEDPTSAKSGTQIPGYSKAEMKAGDTSLKISIGNPKDNKVGFYASFELADGIVLYESELLEPGQGLTEIPLSKTLEKGTYDAKVVYKCVALDEEHTPLNSAESGFTLIVN